MTAAAGTTSVEAVLPPTEVTSEMLPSSSDEDEDESAPEALLPMAQADPPAAAVAVVEPPAPEARVAELPAAVTEDEPAVEEPTVTQAAEPVGGSDGVKKGSGSMTMIQVDPAPAGQSAASNAAVDVPAAAPGTRTSSSL